MGITNYHKPASILTIVLASAILASGCAGTSEQTSQEKNDSSFQHGASLEETQAAFADVDPVTVRFQTGASAPEGALGSTFQDFADEVHEWSDGKVEIELNWAGSVADLTEVDDALSDGRLDLGQLSFTYQPQEFPVTNSMNDTSILTSVSPLSGEIAQTLAMLQATTNSPEVHAEYEAKGIVPLLPIAMAGTTGLACADPVKSVADLQGLQILSNSTVQSQQVAALGGIDTSVEYTELYEAFQRGIVDCALAVPPVYNGMGLEEVAPYFYYPEHTSFQAGPTAILAGSSWETFQLPVRQLIYDKLYEWLRGSNHATFRYLDDSNQTLVNTPGKITTFDSSISEALKATNTELAAGQVTNEDYDAADFTDRYSEALQHWQDEAIAAGYTDEGDYSNFGDWYQGDLSDSSADYLGEFYDSAFEEVAGASRPE